MEFIILDYAKFKKGVLVFMNFYIDFEATSPENEIIAMGVVCRIVNKPKFCAYKHKNWYFKALSGIIIAEVEKKKRCN